MSQKIIKNAQTKNDLVFLLGSIDKIQNLVFKYPDLSLKKKIENDCPPQVVSLFKDFSFPSEPQEQYSLLEEVKKDLKKLPVAKIILAFSPSPELVKEISQWFSENFGKKIILEIEEKPEIMGGLILEYEGKYLDLSLNQSQ